MSSQQTYNTPIQYTHSILVMITTHTVLVLVTIISRFTHSTHHSFLPSFFPFPRRPLSPPSVRPPPPIRGGRGGGGGGDSGGTSGSGG